MRPLAILVLAISSTILSGVSPAIVSAKSSPDGVQSVFTWGADGVGQLGDGVRAHNRCFCASTPIRLKGLNDVVQVQAAQGFTVVLTRSGRVYTFGTDTSGQLGVPGLMKAECECSTRPVLVKGLPPIKQISANYTFTLALARNGSVWAWGDDGLGQLGLGRVCRPYTSTCLYPPGCRCHATPGRVRHLPKIISVATGNNFSIVLAASGRLWGWGLNGLGQIGDGNWSLEGCQCVQKPQRGTITGLKAISAGYGFALGITWSGKAVAWGANEEGQLGNGGVADSDCDCSPLPVTVSNVGPVSEVSAGGFALAVDKQGRLWGWGANFGVTWAQVTSPALSTGQS